MNNNTNGKISPENPKNPEEVQTNVFHSLKLFLSNLLDIRPSTDKEETIEAVKSEITFRGHNAWILIFSVFVASLGLNISSPAVVIGAMLISPLMGPIVGVGLSVAINDIDTLKKSLMNLGIMILLSILTAYFYFLISPLTKLTPELAARTYPTLLDVLVALFGGLALIVAKTKKGTLPSVIYGVAIATALMPPLCTAGYGLAVWNLEYFGGAFYLFTINSIFIALSTFIVAKLLGFPYVRYANSKRRKRISQIATFVAIIVMIPSTLLFWQLLQKEVFASNTETFIQENIIYPDSYLIRHEFNFDSKSIRIYMGGETVPEDIITMWRTKLTSNEKLKDATLQVLQAKDDNAFTSSNFVTLSDMYSKNLELLQYRDAQIQSLRKQLYKFTPTIAFDTLSKELKINYRKLASISYATALTARNDKIDTLSHITLYWETSVSEREKQENTEKIMEWLEFKLKKDTLVLKSEYLKD